MERPSDLNDNLSKMVRLSEVAHEPRSNELEQQIPIHGPVMAFPAHLWFLSFSNTPDSTQPKTGSVEYCVVKAGQN